MAGRNSRDLSLTPENRLLLKKGDEIGKSFFITTGDQEIAVTRAGDSNWVSGDVVSLEWRSPHPSDQNLDESSYPDGKWIKLSTVRWTANNSAPVVASPDIELRLVVEDSNGNATSGYEASLRRRIATASKMKP